MTQRIELSADLSDLTVHSAFTEDLRRSRFLVVNMGEAVDFAAPHVSLPKPSPASASEKIRRCPHHSDAPKVSLGGECIVEDAYVISVADIEHVLKAENVAPPGSGDVVLFYTGWDKLLGIDNDRLMSAPGPGVEAARWLAERKVALVGADTMSVEAIADAESVEMEANPTPLGKELGSIPFALHFILLTQNGIHLLENMKLMPLADDLIASQANGEGLYEFLFTFAPLPIKGLEGSPGQPLAVR